MKFILLFLFSIISLNVWADTFQCPLTLVVTETVTVPKGWSSPKLSTAKTLEKATLYEGQMGDTQMALAPEQIQRKNQLIQTWDLEGEPKKYWMQCQYFNSGVMLMRQLPPSKLQCKNILLLDKQHNVASYGTIECH